MLVTKPYLRERAVEYARKWALSRNPLFTDYTGRGGNCTNFVSQAVYAGSCTMNYTPVYGWYYLTEAMRTASWTGVEFLFNFLTGNEGAGPYGRQVGLEEAEIGDVIQLYRTQEGWYHTMLLIGFDTDGAPLVAAQSDDALDRRLDTYTYDVDRFIHVEGVRLQIPDTEDCFAALLAGTATVPGEGAPQDAPPDEAPQENGTAEEGAGA